MTSPITPERIVYDLPTVSQAVIAPDGSRVAWVRGAVDRETNQPGSQIWLLDIASGERRQLTWTGNRNSDPAWSPDGSTLAFVSTRDGEHPHAICLLPISGGESRVLTTHSRRPNSLAWSEDGSTIAYVVLVDPENPDEAPRDPKAPPPVRVTRRIDYKQDGYGYLGDVRHQIMLVEVESGERRALTSDPVDHLRPAWSPDGRGIVCVLPNRNGILARTGVIDVATGNVEIYGEPDGEAGLAAFAPDGDRVFIVADEAWGPNYSGFVLDLRDGSVRKVLDDPDFQIDASSGSSAFPVWLDADTVLVSGHLRGGSGLWRIDLPSGTTSLIGQWDAIHSGLSVSSDQKVAVQTVSDLSGIIGIARIDLRSGERTVLANEAEAFFAESPPADRERCPVTRDGVETDAWLLKPPAFDESRQWPLVVDIHGGPHGAYGFGFNAIAEILATNGYLVLLVNPRGSTTYGSAYANAIKGDWGGVDWSDLQAVLDAVTARPYVDANRTGVFGYSYGGYMTSWIIGQTDRFRAAVCGAPVFDLESFFGTSDIGHVFNDEQQGGPPWALAEHYRDRSPSSHIHKATTPTLIIHGEADERCPIGQGEQMFISLLKAGCETEFARYPGGYHGFLSTGEPAHRIDAMQRILGWFDRFLKPQP